LEADPPSGQAEIPRPGAAEGPLATAFRSLRHRNYRYWFVGQLVAVIGMWMMSTAQGFLVYELTGSAALLGYLALVGGLPSWLLMLYGGVVADRLARRPILVTTQSIGAVMALVLTVLTLTHAVRPAHILILAAINGVAAAFDAPARQAFVLELVEREDLVNAIALNSTMFNLGTVLGPAIGGLVYAAAGPGLCFGVGVLAPLASVMALLSMRLAARPAPAGGGSRMREVADGLRYTLGHRDILSLIVLVSMVTTFGFSVFTLFPAWSVEVLHGGATVNGLLQSARGAGAVVAALAIAAMGPRLRVRGLPVVGGMVVLPLAIAAFAFARTTFGAMVALAAVGGLMIAIYNIANSLVQTLVDDHIRGRVMSIYMLNFFGFMPIGGLLAGELAERLGLVTAVWIEVAALAGAAAWFWLRAPWLRRLR
jgi:MFS family permease